MLLTPAWVLATRVSEVRVASHDDYVRLVIETDSKPTFRVINASKDAETVTVELQDTLGAMPRVNLAQNTGFILDHRVDAVADQRRLYVHLRTDREVRIDSMILENPWRLILDMHEAPGAATASNYNIQQGGAQTVVAQSAAPVGTRPRTVVIDPGHGGHHRGGTGKVNGRQITEADVTLPIAIKLERMLAADPLFDPKITRRRDIYVGLRERTRLAEQYNGALFVSIHYNAIPASKNPRSARGFEMWTWSPKKGDDAATKYLQDLDNDEGVKDLPNSKDSAFNVLNQMMVDALEEQALESVRFAQALESSFLKDSYFKKHYRGIKNARFKVLENYNMPSVLIEVGFISHPDEAALSVQASFQEKVARYIYNGIVEYYENTDPAFRAARNRTVAGR